MSVAGTFKYRKVTHDNTHKLSNIYDDLLNGSAIPFVGAGASANNLNGSDDYEVVLALVDTEIEYLLASFKPDTSECAKFVREFVKHYVEDRRHKELRRVTPKKDECLSGVHIREFRKALIRFIVHLTEKHTSAIGQNGGFYFFDYNSIPYQADENGKHLAREMLEKLDTLYDDLCANPSGSPRLAAGEEFFRGVKDSLIQRYEPDGEGKINSLHADHILWLADILWLTITIWLPLYPTTRELAVELALVSDNFTRDSERRLGRTAECFDDPEKLAEHVKRRFGKDRDTKHVDALIMDSHAALAIAAVHASEMGQESLIFTTNFDRGLEHAVERIVAARNEAGAEKLIGCRVIYPILIETTASRKIRDKARDDGKVPPALVFYLRWMARDWFGPKSPANVVRWIDLVEGEVGGEKQILGGEFLQSDRTLRLSRRAPFNGPVIVKLHGAPLEEFGPCAEGVDIEMRHYIVVSEHDYIDAIIQNSAPEWLLSALWRRKICFLGYSIEDWNMRLHLARERKPKTPEEKTSSDDDKERGSALVRNVSDAERALYDRMGIGVAAGELRALVQAIYSFRKFREIIHLASFNQRNTKYLAYKD